MWFVLLIALSLPSLAPAPPAGEWQVLLLDDEGTWTRHELSSRLDDSEPRAFWVWSNTVAPIRSTCPEDAQCREAITEVIRNRTPSETVLLRVPSVPEEELPHTSILGAPAAMWGEVPESMIPRFAVSPEREAAIPADGSIVVRVISPTLGTGWRQIERAEAGHDLRAGPATDVRIDVSGCDGEPTRANATVFVQEDGASEKRLVAQAVTGADGLLKIDAVPETETLLLLIGAEECAPTVLGGASTRISGTVQLSRGHLLTGTIIDGDGEPLEDARVDIEFWISPQLAALGRRSTRSSEEGRWQISALPKTRATLRISAPGHGSWEQAVLLDIETTDLGKLTLPDGLDVRVLVLDEREQPLQDAVVTAGTGVPIITDEKGFATVADLDPDSPVRLLIEHESAPTARRILRPPFGPIEQIVVERGLVLRGSVEDSDSHAPVPRPSIQVQTGSEYRLTNGDETGAFSLVVPADEEVTLTVTTPSSAPATITEPPGFPGEIRELTVLRLSRGGTVRGRLVSATTGEPVAGARIWALRPSEGGPLASWTGERMVETESNGEGWFTLSGLEWGATVLRIDSSGFAREYRSSSIDPETPLVDLGLIELSEGAAVTVAMDDAPVSATARIDMRGDWLDVDMLTAPFSGDEALIPNVPEGTHILTVVRENTILCDKEIDVVDHEDVEIECSGPVTVSGTVSVGGVLARGGTLTFRRKSGADVSGVIMNQVSDLGARRQRTFGLTSSLVTEEVTSRGTFRSERLLPGEWQVSWASGNAVSSSSRQVTIPEGEEVELGIDFSGGSIRGRVVDRRGDPVGEARVEERSGSEAVTVSADDGSFTLDAVPPGLRSIRAFRRGVFSNSEEVTVKLGEAAPPVELILGVDNGSSLDIVVLSETGEPLPGAFVFVEDQAVARILTTDSRGIATASFQDEVPSHLRIAGYALGIWTFTDHRADADREEDRIVLRQQTPGRLHLEAPARNESPLVPTLLSETGWNLTLAMTRLGLRPVLRPGSDLLLPGLPPGRYELRWGSRVEHLEIDAGRTRRLSIAE